LFHANPDTSLLIGLGFGGKEKDGHDLCAHPCIMKILFNFVTHDRKLIILNPKENATY
jgi:hypothetical protein